MLPLVISMSSKQSLLMPFQVMFYYCRPMDERMSECSLEEKKRFTDLMFDNIRYNLRVPYPRICREAPNYFVQIGYSIYPQMGRTFSLLHYAVTLGSIMIRLFAVLIIIQVRIDMSLLRTNNERCLR